MRLASGTMSRGGPGERIETLSVDYLLFSDVTSPISTTALIFQGPNSFRGDPDFVDPAQNDYTLGVDSEARDKASTQDCLAVDLDGVTRPQGVSCDIGAYEAEPVSPALAIDPTSFSFITLPGLGQPLALSLNITNIGAGTLNWSVSGDPSWISGSPTSGSQNGTVEVHVDPTDLATGIHQGNLIVDSNATNPQLQASVQVEVLDVCTPMLPDSGFETGNSGTWFTSSSSGNPLIREASEMAELGEPHTGQYAVVLGSQDGENNELYQNVKLPSGGGLTLEYYYQIISDEDGCNFDQVRVLLGDTELTDYDLCPANNTNGWQKGTIDLTPYGNRADSLRFTLQNDAFGNPSVFLLDDITIVPAASDACENPILGVAPTDLSFSGQAGGANPANQVVEISNLGTGSLPWTAQADSEWITLNLESGTGDAELQVGIDLAGLTAASYFGQVTITSDGAEGSPQTIDVALTVDSQPQLEVSPAHLIFSGQVGGANPADQTLNITISDGDNQPWTAQVDSEWITLDSAEGTGNGQLQVGIDLDGLAPGDYEGKITVTSDGAGRSPQAVGVSLTVKAQPQLQASPTELNFTGQVGGENPDDQAVTVTIQNGENQPWTAQADSEWITLDPDSGNGTGQLQVGVNLDGLAPDAYSDQVTITSEGAQDSPQTIEVTLKVDPAPLLPKLQINPTTLTFVMQAGDDAPADQELEISNARSGALAWTATASENWILLSAEDGNAPSTLQVSVDPDGLAVGDHNGQITISSEGAESSPQVVNVSFQISATNGAPSFTSTPEVSATVGVTYTYAIVTTDPDEGDILTLTAPTKPAWLTLTASGNGTATLAGTPSAEDVGDNPVQLRVQDDSGAFATQSFTITVVASTPTEMGSIQGKVVDGDGNPVQGATVTLTPADGSVAIAAQLTQITNNNGNYLFEDVPLGEYTITASKNGNAPSAPITVTVDADDPTPAPTITLQASKSSLRLPLLSKVK